MKNDTSSADNSQRKETDRKLLAEVEELRRKVADFESEKARLESNKKAATDFYQFLVGDRDYDSARKLVGDVYIQHNPYISDGFDSLVHAMETHPKWKDRPKRKLQFYKIVAEGNHVYFQLNEIFPARDDGTPLHFALVELFRFDENGKIVEHWDVLQIAKVKDSVHDKPLF